MAVATEREYGLFINGESTEASSGETRELTGRRELLTMVADGVVERYA